MKPLPLFTAFVITLALFAACKTPVSTSDTSQNALDWQGTYAGVTPCADCEGIITTLQLKQDNTYRLRQQYGSKGTKGFEKEGSFEWNKNGNVIMLQGIKEGDGPRFYKVGENRVVQLDLQGNEITGNLAPMYTLTKDQEGIENRYWKLIEVNGNAVAPNERWRREPHVILHPNGNRVTGHGGCNSFSGSYEVKGDNRIAFSQMASTRMFCNDASEVEDLMLRAIQSCDSYYVSGDSLQLFRARMAPLAKFVAVYLK
jgi:copper homeostasis protein (lipoprotein)